MPKKDVHASCAAEAAVTLPADLANAVRAACGDELAGLVARVADECDRIVWGEQEIAAAQARHPQHADRIWHSFALLAPQPGLERMDREVVYRAHSRELLDRVAAGEDTQPGTAAEVCCALLPLSQRAPLTPAATGLYLRMWQAAGLPEFPELTKSSYHHEGLHHVAIDQHERRVRHTLTVPTRQLRDVVCHGYHHGAPVDCTYATPKPPSP